MTPTVTPSPASTQLTKDSSAPSLKFPPSRSHSNTSHGTAETTSTTFSFDSRVPSSGPLMTSSSLETLSEDDPELNRCISPTPGLGQVFFASSREERSTRVTGEIMVGLHKHGDSELTVSVIQCRNIQLPRNSEQTWYVKLYLMCGENKVRVSKRKTHCQKCHQDPSFHEIFTYHTNFWGEVLEISLWVDRGAWLQNKVVGLTMIALDQVPYTQYPDGEVVCWYKLVSEK